MLLSLKASKLSETETANFQATLKTEDGNGFCKASGFYGHSMFYSSSSHHFERVQAYKGQFKDMLGKQYHTIASCKL